MEVKVRGEGGYKGRDQEISEGFPIYLDVGGLNYEDSCIHPNVDLPKWFNIPKFDTFKGVGNPVAHLRAYSD